MRDIADALHTLRNADAGFALATVVAVSGSAPRPVGTTMVIGSDGTIAGNVSAGCVESAVVEQAALVMSGSAPAGVWTYGITDDDAYGVGLTCGGTIGVLICAPATADRPVLDAALRLLGDDQPLALCTVVSGPARAGAVRVVAEDAVIGSLGDAGLDAAVTADSRGLLASGETGIRHYGPQGGRRHDDVAVLIQSFAPPPRMLIFGAIDFAAALAHLGAFLGYRVTVCDARSAFATPARFPDADDVVVQWPHRYLQTAEIDERTVMCVLTHDPKFDVPLLVAALATPAAYIGVMGSRLTNDDRLRRLRAEGVDEAALERLRAPVGLDLGARTPPETAVSIAAEIIALRWHGTGAALRETAGPIHPDLHPAP